MRANLVLWCVALAPVLAAACRDGTGPAQVPPPANLIYRLEPSGDPERPAGILLGWEPVTSSALEVYRVYSRAGQSGAFGLRASTTSSTFHDRGQPHLEYFVVAVDVNGRESGESNRVIVDERLRLDAPDWLASVSLDGAVHLYWADNAFTAAPTGFRQYRVYSTDYFLDDNLCDEAGWRLEGTTVAPEFLVSAIANGVPQCFGVSAESIEGWESLWSPLRADTPRPDARNEIMTAHEADAAFSGFRFWWDLNGDGLSQRGELGIVTDGDRTDIDFRVTRDVNGDFFFVPVRAGTEIALYSDQPIADLTSIDVAPSDAAFDRVSIQAVPMFGYVFRMDGGDGFARFGAIRVTHVGQDYMVFDWSFQTDPGNPELSVGAGIFTADGEGVTVVAK